MGDSVWGRKNLVGGKERWGKGTGYVFLKKRLSLYRMKTVLTNSINPVKINYND